jgi:hypothetical protein
VLVDIFGSDWWLYATTILGGDGYVYYDAVVAPAGSGSTGSVLLRCAARVVGVLDPLRGRRGGRSRPTRRFGRLRPSARNSRRARPGSRAA